MPTYDDMTEVGYQTSGYQEKTVPKGEKQFHGANMPQENHFQYTKKKTRIVDKKPRYHEYR